MNSQIERGRKRVKPLLEPRAATAGGAMLAARTQRRGIARDLRSHIRFQVFWLLAVSAWCGSPSLTAGAAGVSVQQITHGPKHHFFGYIGQCRTIPWNGNGRYILALQVPFLDRMPGPGDAADIVLIDTQQTNALRVIEHSCGWNPQQGTMFYWNPEAPDTQFFFNDRDPRSGKVFTVLYDLAQGKRLREYRFEDTPVGNGGVAQGGGWFLAINYARLARLRPVTGYPQAYDWTVDQPAPENDGVFKVNVATGREELIVSFARLREALKGIDPVIEKRHLFINHTLCNRDSNLIYFYCRADFEGPEAGRLNVPFTVKPDGSDLTHLPVFIGGHPDWAEGSRLIGATDDQQVVCDAATGRIVQTLGDTKVFPKPGGDISLSPDGRWLVNGHGGKGYNYYTFLELKTGQVRKSPGIRLGTWNSKELRLDPAPCWNRTSDAIVVPGCAEDNTRQMFLIRLEPI